MTAPTITLADFLLARISEDEAVARAALARNGATWLTEELSGGTRIVGTTESGNPRAYRGDSQLWDDEGAMGMFAETAAHVIRHDPARVLAECEAKRRIVERHAETWELGREDYLEGVWRSEDHAIRLLAALYADHPDYRSEWAP